MRKLFWLLGLSLALFGCGFKKDYLVIGNSRLRVEVRADELGRQQGLSGRNKLEEDQGMLFIFDKKARHKFWMKGMKFPLDFVWIDGDEVVGITEKVGVEEMDIRPNQAVDKVLEVNSGWVERQGIKVGDKIRL